MRPSRLIVGEVRQAEYVDLDEKQEVNSGLCAGAGVTARAPEALCGAHPHDSGVHNLLTVKGVQYRR
jgi:hypothetical protein